MVTVVPIFYFKKFFHNITCDIFKYGGGNHSGKIYL